jgi:hypothetical protein
VDARSEFFADEVGAGQFLRAVTGWSDSFSAAQHGMLASNAGPRMPTNRSDSTSSADKVGNVDVPSGFDDCDDDSQVPMVRRQFFAYTATTLFVKAQQWVSEYNVFIVDVSWNWARNEPSRSPWPSTALSSAT